MTGRVSRVTERLGWVKEVEQCRERLRSVRKRKALARGGRTVCLSRPRSTTYDGVDDDDNETKGKVKTSEASKRNETMDALVFLERHRRMSSFRSSSSHDERLAVSTRAESSTEEEEDQTACKSDELGGENNKRTTK